MQSGMLLLCLASVSVVLGLAASEDVDALLQLRALAPAGSLTTWTAGSDPCGAAATCQLGSCSWEGVTCEQGRVTQLNISAAGLSGALPRDWQPPARLAVLDVSNNKQLCGGLPSDLLTRAQGQGTVRVRAAGSGVGQPCPSRAGVGTGSPAGAAAPSPSPTGAASLSDVAKALIGAGVGVGTVAAAAAGTLMVLRRKRANEERRGGPLDGELARAHDSVVVTKRKHHPAAALARGAAGGTPGAGSADAVVVAVRADAAVGGNTAPTGGRLRMVAFAKGPVGDEAGECGGCEGGADEAKARLRASNIQDSVVIIRNKASAGLLGLQQHGSGDEDDEQGALVEPGPAHGPSRAGGGSSSGISSGSGGGGWRGGQGGTVATGSQQAVGSSSSSGGGSSDGARQAQGAAPSTSPQPGAGKLARSTSSMRRVQFGGVSTMVVLPLPASDAAAHARGGATGGV